MSVAVITWASALSVVAVLNIALWAATASRLGHDRGSTVDAASFRRGQLLLAAGYVFGCAYRSFLPVFDVPRVALIDSSWSTAAVGRSVATVAELCFIAQWAMLMRAFSRASGHVVSHVAARVLVPIIVVAEICSWSSVLTRSNLGHVFEESLWSIATALIVATLAVEVRGRDFPWRRAGGWLIAAGLAYLLYLVLVDVPMYWARWIADEAVGKSYFAPWQGFLNASAPHVVSYEWDVWKSEIAWMSAYFTLGVWVSIWLIAAPIPHPRASHQRSRVASPLLTNTG